MKKRIMTVLLCLVMVIGLLPVTAQAAEMDKKTIQLGTGSITGYSAKNSYDYLYMGVYTPPSTTTPYPIKWRVLDTKTNMDGATEGDGLFLLSDGVLKLNPPNGQGYRDMFDNAGYHDYTSGTTTVRHRGAEPTGDSHINCKPSNAWQGSAIRAYYQTTSHPLFYNEEYAAILPVTKSDAVRDADETVGVPVEASNEILKDDTMFYLSVAEATSVAYGFDNSRIAYYYAPGDAVAAAWCLRSPLSAYGDKVAGQMVAVVDAEGAVKGEPAYTTAEQNVGARPAFNLDKEKVLFISAFDYNFDDSQTKDAKNGAVGQLTAVTTCAEGGYAGNSWRPTLLDKERTFDVTETTATAAAGESVTLRYTGAKTDNHEYISAIITDSEETTVLYYGRVQKITNEGEASGTVNVQLPADLAVGRYMLYVFNEKCGDTNISSAFEEVALTVSGSETPPTNPTDPADPAAPADHTHHTGVKRQTVSEQPAADKLESPKTGDGSMMGLWAALLFVGAAGTVGTVAYSRRRRT